VSESVTLELRALGLWTPGYGDALSWARRNDDGASADAAAKTPRAELLPPMLRRRTSLLTRMAAEVAKQAIGAAGFDAAAATMVYGSVYGEIRTTVDLLEQLLKPGEPLSPTKFHNSVHNTAGGYVSITTGNRAGSSALSGGRSTLAMGLLECAALVACDGGDAVLVIAEEPLPEPLAAGRRWGPLAAAFAISAPGRGDMFGRPCLMVQGPTTSSPPAPEWLQGNPCAAALALIDAASRPTAARVALEPHLPAGWTCALAEAV
jgi:hypothetical protein